MTRIAMLIATPLIALLVAYYYALLVVLAGALHVVPRRWW